MTFRNRNQRVRNTAKATRCSIEALEARFLLFSSNSLVGGAIHDAITAQGLDFVKPSTLALIQEADDGVDAFNALGGHYSDNQYHYNDSRFAEAASVIRSEYLQAVNEANPAHFNGAGVAAHFGAALHTIQDFFAHSNWVTYPSLRSVLFDSGLAAWNPTALPGAMFLEGDLPAGYTIAGVNTADTNAANYLQVPVSAPGGATLMGIVTSWYGSESGSRSPAGARIPHGGPLEDPTLSFDNPQADVARNNLYLAAYNLAAQQTRHEFERLTSLISAQYGDPGVQALDNAFVNLLLQASTRASAKGTTLTLIATGAPGAGGVARFYRDTNGNGAFDPSADEYLGQAVDATGHWQLTLLNRGMCIGANTYFATAAYSAGTSGQPASASLNVAKGTAGAAWIIDDEGAAVTLKGKWKRWTRAGYAGDQVYPASTRGNTATWTYTGVRSGTYQIAITWASQAGLAKKVPYAIYDGKLKLASAAVDQSRRPSDLKSEGGSWRNLGNFTIRSGQLRLVMSNPKGKARAYADAVRLSLVKAAKSTSSKSSVALPSKAAMPAASGLIQPDFAWSMPVRYGLDENHNGRIDLPNSFAYVNPQNGYTLTLDASKTTSQVVIDDSGYIWTITGPGLAAPVLASGKIAQVAGLQNNTTYTISLNVHAQDGTEATTSQQAKIHDLLIVALGDSYSSGEGNPDIPQVLKKLKVVKAAQWADGVTPAMDSENREAHRSTFAASSQAALSIENADPHTSVTFVMLSTSGATIDNILSKSKPGMEHPKTARYKVPAQIPELQTIVGSRPIDLTTISVGGNDIGFANRIRDMLLASGLDAGSALGEQIAGTLGISALANLFSGKRLNSIVKSAEKKYVQKLLKRLPDAYTRLSDKLASTFNIGKVIVTDYPDPTHDDNGRSAPILKDVDIIGISATDSAWAQQNILTPLNSAVQSAATAHNWQFAGPLAPDFLTHGYAARNTWFVTNKVGQKTIRLGDLPASSGTLHPNKLGHQNIAGHLVAAMQAHL